ncbi:hypothetical protein FQN55_003307 [Onygenales sp. PD_40]|nr:hypothetical protein FQN55_003307 [Onygenales sp. PD_40]KAK2762930.1 hypothetical protein FQN53_007421 [Emmonsiellopsis sp. PD_33]KAK2789628.1 hypothetical protein FQN52_005967 [Onygenales sp. PD_12]
MRITHEASLFASVFFPVVSSAISFDCKEARVDKKSWDLSPLGGPHAVYNVVEHPPTVLNTTYTLDICKPLKDTPCTAGTMVCGVQQSPDEEKPRGVIPIAGIYPHGPGDLDPKITRLKSTDSQDEGLRIELHGGRYPFNGKDYKQSVVIEMKCDRERSGLEGDWDGKSKKREEEGSGENNPDGNKDEVDETKSLRFKSYGQVDEQFVLRLDWLTKYACEDYKDDGDGQSNHWGFFTWLIVIVFLGTAAYLIFGSWLNYNRYGARGWDLLPHGDTIRDIPYIMKDWGRRVVNTVQGPGSRGGYSAV